MTKTEAAKLVGMLFLSFPSAKVNEGHAEAYESGIIDLDAKTAGEAVDRLRRTKVFLPSISEIRGAVADVQLGPPRSGAEAYGILQQTFRVAGRHEAIRWRDPNLAAALRMTWGDWVGACNAPDPDVSGRARFIEAYEMLATRERADIVAGKALPPPRVGGREFTSGPSGRDPEPPRLPRMSAEQIEQEMAKRG